MPRSVKAFFHSVSEWCKDFKEIIGLLALVVGLIWAGLSWTIRYQTSDLAKQKDVADVAKQVQSLSERIDAHLREGRANHVALRVSE
jgi:NAD-specific glutamate dehydrogenase